MGTGGWNCHSIAALSPARSLRLPRGPAAAQRRREHGSEGQEQDRTPAVTPARAGQPDPPPGSSGAVRGAASPYRGAAFHPEERNPRHPAADRSPGSGSAIPGTGSPSRGAASLCRGPAFPPGGPSPPPAPHPPRGRTYKRLRTERGRCSARDQRTAPQGPRPCAKRRAAGR